MGKTFYLLKSLANLQKKEIRITSKTELYHTDDKWCLDLLDLNNYIPKKGNRYVLVTFDNFFKFCGTVSLKKKTSQATKDLLEKIPRSSRREPIELNRKTN